jgi:hypothetical protein
MKKGDLIRFPFKYGYYYGRIDKVRENDFEISYDTKKQFDLHLDSGYPLNWWCHLHEFEFELFKPEATN